MSYVLNKTAEEIDSILNFGGNAKEVDGILEGDGTGEVSAAEIIATDSEAEDYFDA